VLSGSGSEIGIHFNTFKQLARTQIQVGVYFQQGIQGGYKAIENLSPGMYLLTDNRHTCGAVLGHPDWGSVCFDPHNGSVFSAGNREEWSGLADVVKHRAGLTSVKKVLQLWARPTAAGVWGWTGAPPSKQT
jgi:hypothetical protein